MKLNLTGLRTLLFPCVLVFTCLTIPGHTKDLRLPPTPPGFPTGVTVNSAGPKANLDVVNVKVKKGVEKKQAVELRVSATIVNEGGPTANSLTAAGLSAHSNGRSKVRIEWDCALAPDVYHEVCVKEIPPLSKGGRSNISCTVMITCNVGHAAIARPALPSPCTILPDGTKKFANMAFRITPDATGWIDESTEGGANIGWGVYPDWY